MSRDLSITATDNGTQPLTPTNGVDPNLTYNAGGTVDDGQVIPADIEALTDATIRLQAARDLIGSSPVTLSTSGQGLTLQAGRNITLDANGGLQASGTIRLDAGFSGIPGSDSAGILNLAGSITSTGGGVVLTAGTGASTVSGDVATAAGLTIDTSGTATLSGVVSGAGGLTQAGSGTTVLSSSSTYTGATTVSAGTLVLGTFNGIADSEVVNVAAGATFDVSQVDNSDSPFGPIIKGLSGAGNVVMTTTSGTTQMSSKGLTLSGSGTNTFSGTISGTGFLEQGGTGTQILTGVNTYTGMTTISSGRLQLGDGGTSGSIANTSSITLNNDGILAVNRSDALTISQTIGGSGRFVQAGIGTTTLSAANTYSGGTTIDAGTLDLGSSGGAGSGAITFSSMSGSATAQLVLEQGAQAVGGTFANTLNDFGDNEALILRGFAFNGTASYTVSNGTLTVTGGTNGTQTQTFTLTNTNEPAETTYFARDDGQGGTIISSDLVCYVQGTRIRTIGGEVAVEALRVGDLVVTASGAHRPVRWIGHRTVACRRHPQASLVMPVRIAADAFGESRPTRDLYVSPAHALCVNVLSEVLIPAIRLVNGTTITQVEVETVTYWHVELDSHDILLAEGLPAESYLDCGNRHFFANAEVTDLHATPDAGPEGGYAFCRPFHESGALVDLVRARLAERAAALAEQVAPLRRCA